MTHFYLCILGIQFFIVNHYSYPFFSVIFIGQTCRVIILLGIYCFLILNYYIAWHVNWILLISLYIIEFCPPI